MISNRGTAFTSKQFAAFTHDRGIQYLLTAVTFPWANGQIKSVNRFLRSTLAKMVNDLENWKTLDKTQYVLNTFHRAIDTSPSKLFLGYEQRQNDDTELRALIERLTKIEDR